MRKFVSFIGVILVLFFSCKTEYAYTAEGFVKAEVRNYDVDGCGYLLFLENGKKLNPGELKEEFRKDALKVWIRYSLRKGVMTTYMAGENIQLNDIRKRK